MSSAVTPQLRATLASVADLMVPGDGEMPAASVAGVAENLLDDVLRARPDLQVPLVALLQRIAPLSPDGALAAVRDDRAAEDLLALVVVGGYMMHPAVGAAVHYPGQQPQQVNPFDINDVIDEGLLDPVVERGSIYRPTP
ncbi:MAG: hypothetical protein ITG02_10145 [Patulibacter sp.]|nr:hypothetical protein [Patulibacter sp.]